MTPTGLPGVKRRALREPAHLRAPGRIPWWLIPLIAALLLAGWVVWEHLDQPSELADVALAGPRSPVPLDIVVLLDESGSFDSYARVREETIRQLTQWAPANLLPDDSITVIGFADDAVVRMPRITVAELTQHGAPGLTGGDSGGGTEIEPALRTAATADSSRIRTLIMVTDTHIQDHDPARVDELIRGVNAVSLSTIIPEGVNISSQWQEVFSWGEVFSADPGSSHDVALAIGEALAHATSQRLIEE